MLRSPTCASETRAAIDAIRMPARSMRIRPGKRQVMRLGHSHLSRRSTALSRRPCPTLCPSLRAGPPLNPSSSRTRPDQRRGRRLTGLQKKNPRLKCHPKSSPKCLHFLDRGNRQPSTAVTELSERKNILRDDGARGADQGRRLGKPRRCASLAPGLRSGMMQGVEPEFDRKTLVVRMPMRFQRRVVASGSSLRAAASSSRQPAPAQQRHEQGDRPCLSGSTWLGGPSSRRDSRNRRRRARLGRRDKHARLSARRRARRGRVPVSRWHPGVCELGWR